MHTKLTSRPVDQAIAAIQALDLEPIRLRVMDAELGEGWTREYAESVEGAYRNYLTMLMRHPEDIEDMVVSKDVDEFWHTHILHTMKYTEDCDKVFGKYLHHNPHVGKRTPADVERKAALAGKTRRLYQQEFGSETAKGGDAAFCSAAVEAKKTAFCSAAIRAGAPAFCSAAVETGNAAFCSAAVKTEDAAFCSAAVEAKRMAFCSATIQAGNPAFCSASITGRAFVRTI